MTCQWCIHYRRRKGISMCLDKIHDGSVITGGSRGDLCERFESRRVCTTCEHRCSPDEKESNMSTPGGCPKWEVRNLMTWGGNRYRTAKNNVEAKKPAANGENGMEVLK